MGDWGIGVFQDDHAADAAADIREADDPNAYIEEVLRSFLEETSPGYDRSEHAEDWKRAREIMAICEVVRLGSAGSDVPDKIPPTLQRWLASSRFKSAPGAVTLAAAACQRLAESDWLAKDWPELWQDTFLPLQRKLKAAAEAAR